jgi:hypothetical protein
MAILIMTHIQVSLKEVTLSLSLNFIEIMDY